MRLPSAEECSCPDKGVHLSCILNELGPLLVWAWQTIKRKAQMDKHIVTPPVLDDDVVCVLVNEEAAGALKDSFQIFV